MITLYFIIINVHKQVLMFQISLTKFVISLYTLRSVSGANSLCVCVRVWVCVRVCFVFVSFSLFLFGFSPSLLPYGPMDGLRSRCPSLLRSSGALFCRHRGDIFGVRWNAISACYCMNSNFLFDIFLYIFIIYRDAGQFVAV